MSKYLPGPVRSRMRVWRDHADTYGINAWARIRAKARRPRLVTRVSPLEDMFTGGNNLGLYFEVGASALEQIVGGLKAAGVPAPNRILDLPCGYGRVLRHIRAEWPKAEIWAMDLLPTAPEFCAEAFRCTPVISRQPLWDVEGLPDDFDLLWCGSLLTHFDTADWVPTLSYFRDRLTVGGTLVFTTHGELPLQVLEGQPHAVATLGRWVGDYGVGANAERLVRSARSTGFAFSHYGDDTGPYGLSVSLPEWVRATVAGVPGLEFVRFVPAGWFQHHDVWTYRRVPAG